MGTARRLERAEAAAAFNPGLAVGRGSAGSDPSHPQRAPPFPRRAGAGPARRPCACHPGSRRRELRGRNSAPSGRLGGSVLGRRNVSEASEALPGVEPQGAERGLAPAAGCRAPLSRARPGSCPPLPPPGGRRSPGLRSCARVKGSEGRPQGAWLPRPHPLVVPQISVLADSPTGSLRLLKPWARPPPSLPKTPRPLDSGWPSPLIVEVL